MFWPGTVRIEKPSDNETAGEVTFRFTVLPYPIFEFPTSLQPPTGEPASAAPTTEAQAQ